MLEIDNASPGYPGSCYSLFLLGSLVCFLKLPNKAIMAWFTVLVLSIFARSHHCQVWGICKSPLLGSKQCQGDKAARRSLGPSWFAEGPVLRLQTKDTINLRLAWLQKHGPPCPRQTHTSQTSQGRLTVRKAFTNSPP